MNDDLVGTPSPGATGHRSDVGWERATLEKLAFSALAEQRAARRWTVFWRLMWLLLAGAVLWMVFRSDAGVASVSTPHTALIEIRGEIAAGAEASADNVVTSLNAAFEDAGAQAVVLLIDSPGGSPVQAGIINDEITRLKALHNKKVYAVVEETCASAAYYIAAAADNIYVDKASLVGSIGVLMDGFGFTGLMDKLGVERRLMTAGANKAMLDPFSPQDAEQTAYIQSMLGEIHSQFITVVRAGRGERLKETPDTFSGLVWSGQKAIALGLVDGLGSLDYVAREVVKAEEVVDYTQRENLGMRLARQLGASVGEGMYLAARSSGLKFK
ncbi:MAG TPA: S49 family peptidase [Hydrogenophaga sp.]|jgi:protease-4|uniref:S49 family peptidase n=1 Tax=Hydrogenophaga TaxID=47420 RepID=UPI0008C2BDF9|nr:MULTISPECIES: S49 family peptidase [Hydrogenophaga]MBU4184193.1 S49 family peptidase [Gammaproteobacteria bacterium]OGA77451.1 MAG: peptidase S49 [Burkholderiales bacterium GWE1_65_30]OGA93878.1 MAG: peptidase S49 [Burkholderiales bacterium GWF1_66_17]PKO78158.1 MAG: S49 family peptidase [Betaproteobacteria bacterium HGW-Betaproteobacteria-15]MBU4282731.1 S49 family peptidase [Gammaproteobacteria bacterium]